MAVKFDGVGELQNTKPSWPPADVALLWRYVTSLSVSAMLSSTVAKRLVVPPELVVIAERVPSPVGTRS